MWNKIVNPKTGRKVSVRLGKFGPMAQIGTVDEEEKPIFAGLLPDQKISKITLEQTLDLFKLPCYLGDFENEKIEKVEIDRKNRVEKISQEIDNGTFKMEGFEITKKPAHLTSSESKFIGTWGGLGNRAISHDHSECDH